MKTRVRPESIQLGMNYSTAQNRLKKDILFKYIKAAGDNFCYRCGKEIHLESLSVEHKVPWLHTENPIENFFNLDNVGFSHLFCNTASARKPNKLSPEEKEASKKRQNKIRREKLKSEYTTEKRRHKYLTKGY